MSIRLIFAWYDFWIGLFWNNKKKRLYIFPIPMLGIVLDFSSNYTTGAVNVIDYSKDYLVNIRGLRR